MILNTDHLRRCILTMKSSLTLYDHAAPESIDLDVYRNAIVKGYELTLETIFKLLKKALKDFGHSSRKLDTTPIKDILRLAATHGLMTLEEAERWFAYRDNRNSTAHEYVEGFAKETLAPLSAFVADVIRLEALLRERFGERTVMGTPGSSSLILSPRHRDMLAELLQRYIPDAEVWVYGSRVNGDCHEASDLDLVVHGAYSLSELEEALVESNLPIRVDVVDWERIPESFRQEIRHGYVVVQRGQES